MYVLKRIFNILQADINTLFDKIEKKQAARKHGKKERDYDWNDFKGNYNKDSGSDSKNFNDMKNHNDKLAQYYANLEVPYGSDIVTVKNAWKRLIKKCHPDLHANDPHKKNIATELTSKLNEAYREIEKSHIK